MAQQQQDYLTPLLELYASQQQNKQLNSVYNNLAQQQQQQMSNLNGLYSPNSAYAQTLREQLNRRDAAKGVRSQYGPREVELQAKLASQQGQANQAALQALYSPQAMMLAQRQANTSPRSSLFNSLSYANQAYKLGSGAYKTLSDLYRSYDTANKYSSFKDAVASGNAVDDTIDPELWSSMASYDPGVADYYNGMDYSALNLGDLYNYQDLADMGNYVDYAQTASDVADAASYASDASDTADYASTASDLADWWG